MKHGLYIHSRMKKPIIVIIVESILEKAEFESPARYQNQLRNNSMPSKRISIERNEIIYILPLLSKRELYVLQRVADGLEYKQIGNEATIKNQVMSIRLKLSAVNTIHAVAIGIRKGLIK
jgi:DNA-binding NarL/FixJ family response regulator